LTSAAKQLSARFRLLAFAHCHLHNETRAALRGNGHIFTPLLRESAAADAAPAPAAAGVPAVRHDEVPLFRPPGASLPATVTVSVTFRVVQIS
jgi:hypothetical protein